MSESKKLEANKNNFRNPNQCGFIQNVTSALPKRRQNMLKWNGWGYKDSKFVWNAESQQFSFSGNRYAIANKILPDFKPWIETTFGIELTQEMDKWSTIFSSWEDIKVQDLPSPIMNEMFLQEIGQMQMDYSLEPVDRLFRAHGHTMREILELRLKKFKRIPDIVIWPSCHHDVVKVVQLAVNHDVVIIPFGGGTSVSGGVECPENEMRMIVSLDMTQMNRILWVNKANNTALIEAGIIGQDLERELEKFGLCTGHEPDSNEFSTLGGWVATRSSGMKKNIYGNIDDMVVHLKMVTPKGVIERNCLAPRISGGPDIHQIILGSEGILGVITEVVLQVRPCPAYKKYGSVIFPAFENGVQCLHEIVRQHLKPASIRLMDNSQFIFGRALKPEATSRITSLADRIVKYYVTQIKKFDVKNMCAVTLLMEGTKKEVQDLEKNIYSIATKYGGFAAGEANGKRGYMLTFVIAYLRDLALDFGIVSESFETSVPWDKVIDLCRNVKDRIACEVRKHSIPLPPYVSCRVTQSYDVGACIYFYFGFSCMGVSNPIETYENIEIAARDEILANGGSISHHHGVGKLRKRWLDKTVSHPGLEMLRAIKNSLDPLNIFASGNLFDVSKMRSSL